MTEQDKRFYSGIFIGLLAGIIMVIVANMFIVKLAATSSDKAAGTQAKIEEIYSYLDRYYVDEYDKQKLEDSMFLGMVYGVGDPYTSYMDVETYKSFMEQTEGLYSGIGVSVGVDTNDNTIKVETPFEGSPGLEAGLLPGDKIVKVNGIDVFGDTLQSAINMMKGEPGTDVTITVYRESERRSFDLTITRAKITIPTVSHKMLENDIGYIRITNFERVTTKQFKDAYNYLVKNNMQGLIIDLRNNPGGLLTVVTDITDMLVPEGTIVYTETKSGHKEYTKSDKECIQVPLLIIVNENSASASEVLSGAVKDLNVGELVGVKTFGKGLVQNLFELKDKSAIKITIAKYYTPSGVCINGEGIIPDYIVELPDELTFKIAAITAEEDTQLTKAMEVMELKIEQKKAGK